MQSGDIPGIASERCLMSDTKTEQREHRGASNSLIVRLHLADRKGVFEEVVTLLGRMNVSIGSLGGARFIEDPTQSSSDRPARIMERDITVNLASAADAPALVAALNAVEGVSVKNYSDATELAHLGGKIEIVPKRPINNADDLARVYTPGVARVCLRLKEKPEDAYNLTMKGSTILIVTDGSRILALGNIGPVAGLPVMEGKAALFKRWGDVNAVPICLATQDPEEIIRTVKNIAPAYGGINLEDIASPGCWEIERRLQAELDIPVFHDDQHGTAIVVLAGTLNAAKVVRKQLRNMRIVVSGVGAAGMACCRLLIAAGVKHIVGFKKEGAIFAGRGDMNSEEQWLAANSKSWFKVDDKTTLKGALKNADMFLGLSAPNLLEPEDLKVMRRDAIVFALANPVAEVDPDGARKFATVIGTGSSEYENQINNALVFPGFFRGLLDVRVRDITVEMKLAAARALANVIPRNSLNRYNIIPDVFDQKAHEAVANAVRCVAHECGLARRTRKSR
jgi:malate dehydrogenase (oxaloacetate-decarboxylating)